MPAARKEAIKQHQAGKRSGEDVAKAAGLSHLVLVRSVTDGRAAQTLGAQDCIA
jgi:hypothetical protein